MERATGVIFLDDPAHISLYRYLCRTWFECARQGGLPGVRENLKWEMIHHIVATTDASRKHNDALFRRLGLPKVRLATPLELARFYRSEGLHR